MIDVIASKLSQCKPKALLITWLMLLLVTLLAGAYQWHAGSRIQSDILAMLPQVKHDPLIQRAQEQVENHLADRVYIALTGNDQAEVIQAAKLLLEGLQADTNVFSSATSADTQLGAKLNQFYFPHRFHLLTQSQAKQLTTQDISPLVSKTLEQLYSAFGFASSELLARDPLLLYPDNMLALAPSNTLSQSQGILLQQTNTSTSAIIMAKATRSAFNPNAQRAQSLIIESTLSNISNHYPEIQIDKAGALFHAIAATQTAKKEVSQIGLISLLGVMLLVWLAFRSLMPLAIAVLTITAGLLVAVTSTIAFFGEIHLLTLVFGTSLIGISIDYSFHFYCERLSQPKLPTTKVIQSIFPAISLALITSAIAYIGIGFNPFPGMQQVAVFCASGLLTAYLTLILAYPSLASSPLPTAEKKLILASRYLQLFMPSHNKMSSKLYWGVLVLLILVTITTGLPRLTSDDNIRNLQQSPIEVIQQETFVRTLLSGGTDNQFLLVRAASEQALLMELETLSPELDASIISDELTSYISLSRYLPSQKKQAKSYQLQQQVYQRDLMGIIHSLGLNKSIEGELKQAYLDAKDEYILPAAFFDAVSPSSLQALWLPPATNTISNEVINNEFGAIILLGGITDLEALSRRISAQTSTELIDKVATISDIMGQYRNLTFKLLALALTCAALIFYRRFGLRKASIVVSIPIIAITLTLATLGLAGSPISLFHTLALVLVLGIGVDYSLFFAEAKHHARGVMMAVFLSACSTLLAFGLLALSQTPAIHYFGLTLALGIGYTFFLSPLIQTLTRNM